MKNTHTCPKCQSQDVIHVPAKSQKAGFDVGSNIHLGVTNFSLAGVDRYVCAMCGYVEDWISSPEDLERIKKKFAS